MPRYIDADALIEALQTDYDREGAKSDEMALKGLADISVKYSHGQFCFLNAIDRVKDTPTADVVPKSEVERLKIEVESLKIANRKLYEASQEVARAFRQRMNEKMGKHTHLLGKEYVQRIMREIEKEFSEVENDRD